MTDVEYEDGYDLKKIGAIAIIVIGLAFISFYFVYPENYSWVNLSNISEFLWQNMDSGSILEDKVNENIKTDYTKYLEFGITEDDVIDIQSLDCSMFLESNKHLMPNDTKYDAILEQRRAEC